MVGWLIIQWMIGWIGVVASKQEIRVCNPEIWIQDGFVKNYGMKPTI